MHMFALVDCHNFQASCKRVFQPQFNRKLIAVLSNNDGCVIWRNDEAKALGLFIGAPAFKYEVFLQFKGFENYDLNTYGLQIRQRILKWTGIPTSVSTAPTKALSKVAHKIARKFPNQTNGSYLIDSEYKRIKALK
jgi:DNA polymerase V